MTQRITKIIGTVFKKNIWDTVLYPLEVLGFSFSKTLLTISGVKVIYAGHRLVSSTARLLTSEQSPLSTVNTLPKNLLKISAFILGSVLLL